LHDQPYPAQATRSQQQYQQRRHNTFPDYQPTVVYSEHLQRDIIQDTFAEMVSDAPSERDVPLVVLDCANIGWNYGREVFDPRGIEIALKYFHGMKIEVQAFLPAGFLRAKPRSIDGTARGNALMVTDDVELLTTMLQQNLITTVPTGDSDDAYILNYARDNNGFVLSNDLFNDHLNSLTVESVRNSMKVWLRDHRCGYTFTPQGEFLCNPCSELRTVAYRHQLRVHQQQSVLYALGTADGGAAAPLWQIPPPLPITDSGVNTSSIYSTDQPFAYNYHVLTAEHPVTVSATTSRGQFIPLIRALSEVINQLSILPGCPVPPFGRTTDAARIGIPAVGDGSVAGLAVSDSLQAELRGLLIARAGLLAKVSAVPNRFDCMSYRHSRSGYMVMFDQRCRFCCVCAWFVLLDFITLPYVLLSFTYYAVLLLILQAGYREEATRDLQYLLLYVDVHCTEAHAALQKLSS
jgi:hypothetical protein